MVDRTGNLFFISRGTASALLRTPDSQWRMLLGGYKERYEDLSGKDLHSPLPRNADKESSKGQSKTESHRPANGNKEKSEDLSKESHCPENGDKEKTMDQSKKLLGPEIGDKSLPDYLPP